ncbi:MAG: lysylphosphatidylglycerol synthase transmembrane domain-containing protein [Terriglobales bacterium]|jgi:glycosyltransferase 2 family protein
MTTKRILMLLVVVAVLAVLVYFQFRTWERFDWGTFREVTGDLSRGRGIRHILIAIALIFFTYWLRAVRWKIFLKPVCRASLRSLTPTQFIGFTGLALLGRPGELMRPYLIARKEGLTMSSQMAVWTVERIFDIGAFTVLMSIDVFAFQDRFHMHVLQTHPQILRDAGLALVGLVAGLSLIAMFIHWRGRTFADWLETKLSPLSPRIAGALAHKIRAFRDGLNTIQDGKSFLQLAGVSLAIWFLIALAYRYVLHAYPQPELRQMHVPQVMLLMASSMVGSMIQLPAIGGGSQLAVISMLSSPEWFNVPKELAVSAGILLWLVTFMTVIPVGLALSRHEHLSISKLSKQIE